VDALLGDPKNKVVGVSRSPEYKDFFLPYKKRDNRNFSYHRIDMVRSFDKLAKLLDDEKPAVVINVAALSEVGLSNERPTEYFEINTLAVAKLCEHLRGSSYFENYVHISSGEVFGSCDGPVAVDQLFKPSTPYAVSKAAADMHLNTLMQNFDFPAYIIRSTNVFGRHQQLFKIIPRCVIYLKMGKTIEMHGGGTAIKSFIHIRDVIEGMMLAMASCKPGTYQFTSSSEDTIHDVIRQVCEVMGRDFEKSTKVVGERLGQDARYWLDCTKSKSELNWNPTVDFREGIREVIDWVEENWEAIQLEPLDYIHKV